jgi:hypothetical protein
LPAQNFVLGAKGRTLPIDAQASGRPTEVADADAKAA